MYPLVGLVINSTCSSTWLKFHLYFKKKVICSVVGKSTEYVAIPSSCCIIEFMSSLSLLISPFVPPSLSNEELTPQVIIIALSMASLNNISGSFLYLWAVLLHMQLVYNA